MNFPQPWHRAYCDPMIEDPRPSYPVPSIHHQTLLSKSIFEHCIFYDQVAAIAMASKSIQNSSLSANFANNVVIDTESVLLFNSVFHPSSSIPIQFSPGLRIADNTTVSNDIQSFIRSLKRTKYFHKSLRNLTIRGELLVPFLGSAHEKFHGDNNNKITRKSSEPDDENDLGLLGLNDDEDQEEYSAALNDVAGLFPVEYENEFEPRSDDSLFTNLQSITVNSVGASTFRHEDVEIINTSLTSLQKFSVPTTTMFHVTQFVTFKNLVSIKNLSHLQLRFNTQEDFDDLTRNQLVSLTSIEFLFSRPGMRQIGISEAEKFCFAFPSLTSLKFHIFVAPSAVEKIVTSPIGQQLRTLRLFSTCDEILSHVAANCHQNLSDLDIADSGHVTDAGMELVTKKLRNNLTSLNLSRDHGLSSKTLENISSFHNLTYLNLACIFTHRNQHVVNNNDAPIGTAEVAKLCARLPKLTQLILSGNEEISFMESQNLSNALMMSSSSVEVLYLDGCFGVDDKNLPFIVKSFPNLRYLKIQGHECVISDVGLASLKSLEFLETLVLIGCNHLSDEGMIDLVTNGCKRLSALRVECVNLTDEFIYKIIPRLRKTNFALLDLTGWGGCPKISYDSLNLLKKECPRLVLMERNQAPPTK